MIGSIQETVFKTYCVKCDAEHGLYCEIGANKMTTIQTRIKELQDRVEEMRGYLNAEYQEFGDGTLYTLDLTESISRCQVDIDNLLKSGGVIRA